MPPTPSLLKVLSLQFTPEEAALALQTHLSGGTLDELASRTGIGKTKLLTMADKGTIVHDPAEEDPICKVAGMTVGGRDGHFCHPLDCLRTFLFWQAHAVCGKTTGCEETGYARYPICCREWVAWYQPLYPS
jgi:hypothetical protein